MDCIQKAKEWIELKGLFQKISRIIAAVSGGPDSMALLTILNDLASQYGYSLSVAFFDHGIRPETDDERALVEEYSAKLGLKLMTGRAEVPREARKTKMGTEEIGRKLRYDFLYETAERENADAVALGHTEDDQIETILHHIIRGSGMKGLTGIPAKRKIFIRPLLTCKRSQLVKFLRSRNVNYAIDISNRDNSFTRNKIRNELLPYLRKNFNPSIDSSLLRLQKNITDALNSLKNSVDSITTNVNSNGSVSLSLDEISKLDNYQLYLLTDRILRKKFDIHQDYGQLHFDAIRKLIQSGQSGRSINLPHALTVSREQLEIRFSRNKKKMNNIKQRGNYYLPGPGNYLLEQWNISITINRFNIEDDEIKTGKNEAFLSNIEFPLNVRERKNGDRLIPLGMKGSKKLSDIFIDRKVPLHKGTESPLLKTGRVLSGFRVW